MHRVLVVEDEVAVGRALERLLRRWGAQVHMISHPVDAPQLEGVLREQQPSVVLSDLMLHAALDGVAVLKVARRVVPMATRALLSGSLFMVDEAMRREIDPCVYLAKPWDPHQLRLLLGPGGAA
ncbi:MAG TPA: response regulator [Archangium sp.]